MKSISPIFTANQAKFEYNVAPEIIGLPVSMQVIVKDTGASSIINPWGTSFRFQLSDEERAKIAAGADLILTEINYGHPITPTNVQFCMAGEIPYFGEGPNTIYAHEPEAEQNSKVLSIDQGKEPENVGILNAEVPNGVSEDENSVE